jgi:hypothetical protein
VLPFQRGVDVIELKIVSRATVGAFTTKMGDSFYPPSGVPLALVFHSFSWILEWHFTRPQ